MPDAPDATTPDAFDLYERCVQSAPETVPLLRAIHGSDPRILGEDFAGTAAVSRAWVRSVEDGRAIAVDRDPAALRRASERARDEFVDVARMRLLEGDVTAATEAVRDAADVVYAGNFSICEWHRRPDLVAYLRHVRRRLRPGGVFVCDLYGGDTAYSLGSIERLEPGPGDGSVLYTWEQREADPLTARVLNALHFEVRDADDEPVALHEEAFLYDWRLWTVPEIRDALEEAGFEATEVHGRVPDAIDDEGIAYVRPLDADDELDDSFDVLVVGRAAGD